ncbi:hypothetical protein [Amycolatopsis sp. cmx-4-68]|uniref:hypothetical protein n=1 Tax=Amycolatopsis sp. cmx-4-68 TaxID=2790938 RepID=UPI003978F8CD
MAIEHTPEPNIERTDTAKLGDEVGEPSARIPEPRYPKKQLLVDARGDRAEHVVGMEERRDHGVHRVLVAAFERLGAVSRTGRADVAVERDGVEVLRRDVDDALRRTAVIDPRHARCHVGRQCHAVVVVRGADEVPIAVPVAQGVLPPRNRP